MARRCKCSGGCCGPQGDDVSRREFLTITGGGAAATLLTGSALADWVGREATAEEMARWREALSQPSPPRVYRSELHRDARMHLGGIGTGNVEIGCDGQFTTWQLFNTLRDGQIPLMFAVKAGGKTKLLQTAGGPDWPRVKQIEMTGEYPIADLRCVDPDLPVNVELSAFTPFAPLDSRFSSQPLIAMVFRIHNPTAEDQAVSLAAMMQNAVGYDAIGPVEGVKHGKYGGNVNEPFRDGPAAGLLMRAEPGIEPSLDRAVALYVGANMQTLQMFVSERPKNLAVTTIANNVLEGVKIPKPAESVIWFEEPPADFSASSLKAAKQAVEAGATLVFSGKTMPLMDAYAKHCGENASQRHGELSPPLAELLPARFTAVRLASGKQPADHNSLEFDNLQLQPNSQQRTLRGGFRVFVRALGKSQVVLAAGAILDPNRQEAAELRHPAYGAMCELAGANYAPPQGVPPSAWGFGEMALVALADKVTVLPAFEDWNDAWKQFQSQGSFTPVDQARANAPTSPGRSVNGAVAVAVKVPAGGAVEVPFLLAWRYPNKYEGSSYSTHSAPSVWIGCHYATLWPDAKAVIHEAAANFPMMRRRTESFRKTFYDSTLPYWMLDCMTLQAATIRHIGVVFRIANGDIYGWEGSNGCCQPTCTHVWGYEQSLARLFPDLERDMRRIDFKHQQRADGGVNNRTDVPSPPHPTCEGPATDGHASCVLKAYREALNHPDDGFFQEYWPHVKKAVEYLINRDAATGGGKPQGILLDDQHNTYDEDLHGATSFISAYYLAALRAGEEWAKRMGDQAAAGRFREIFLAGRENIVRRCWNGEYFQQDLPDYMKRNGEVGPGCMSDQLIGQWWAHQLGLGYILPKDKVQAALRSIFKYNWRAGFAGFKQSPRAFVGDKDKGLLVCTWPKGGRPPVVMLYSDEVWTGMEYQAAAHMIYEGMIEEGLALVRGARDRYDGVPGPPIGRNPWNEIECGGHYARAMSSWSLLLAASGFRCDGPAGTLEFAPNLTPERFKAFFSGPECWGWLEQVRSGGKQRNEIHVVEGRLPVATVRLSPQLGVQYATMTLAGAAVPTTFKGVDADVVVTPLAPIVLKAGQSLVIVLSFKAL